MRIAAAGGDGLAGAGAAGATVPLAAVALSSVFSSPAAFAAFLFVDAGALGVAVALCTSAATAATVAVSVAAVATAAGAAGADDAAAAAGGDEVGSAAAEVAGLALSLPEGSCGAAVVAFEATVALKFAAEFALAAAALCLRPFATTAFTIALSLAFALPTAPVVEFAALGTAAAWFKPKSKLPLSPGEPLVGAVVCCAACGGLAGGFAAFWGGLAGAVVLASSNAANGCGSLSWLGVAGCIRDGGENETAAGKSDAILGILDTLGPLEPTATRYLPATGGPLGWV